MSAGKEKFMEEWMDARPPNIITQVFQVGVKKTKTIYG